MPDAKTSSEQRSREIEGRNPKYAGATREMLGLAQLRRESGAKAEDEPSGANEADGADPVQSSIQSPSNLTPVPPRHTLQRDLHQT